MAVSRTVATSASGCAVEAADQGIWSANREGARVSSASFRIGSEGIGAKRFGAAGARGRHRWRPAAGVGQHTRRDQRTAGVATDLVEPDSVPPAPILCRSQTSPMWAGFLPLAVVLDAWSRRVVGWLVASHLRTALVLDALNMAIRQRRPRHAWPSSSSSTHSTIGAGVTRRHYRPL